MSDGNFLDPGSAVAGGATEAKQDTQITSLQLIDDTVYTDGTGTVTKGIAVLGQDGTNPQAIKTDAAGELQVDVLTMPTVTVQATNLDIHDLDKATDDVTVFANTIKDGSGTAYTPLVDTDGHLQVDILSGGSSGTQYTEGDTDATITGTAIMWEDGSDTLRVVSAANPLPVDATLDPTGLATSAKQDTIIGHVDGIEGLLTTIAGDTTDIEAAVELIDDTIVTLGTDTYTEASSKGQIMGAVRRDADTTLVNTTNEFTPLQVDANGRLKVEAFSGEALPVTLTSTTVTGTVAVTQSGTWDEVGINDSGNSITVDNAIISVVGSGTEAAAQRVTIATDSTGVLSVDDNGGNLSIDDGGNSITVDNGGTFAVQVSSLPASTNTIEVVGDVAHDSAVGGNPILNGAEGRDTLGTAVTSGDVVRQVANRYGHSVTTSQPTSHASSNGTPITATTTSVITAPSAGSHLRIMRIHLSNASATPTWVRIRDGAAGTQHYPVYLVTGSVISLNLNKSGPLDLSTATRLDIVLSATASVEYEIDYLTVAD